MAYVKRKDGRHAVAYRDKVTGKHIWEYFGHGLEAEKAAKKRDSELTKRKYIRTNKTISPKFYELANEYLENKSGKIQKTSMDNMLIKLKGIILPELGNLEALKINHHRINQYIKKRLKTNRTITIRYGPGREFSRKKVVLDKNGEPKKVKTTTVHRELSDIIAILNWAANPERKFIPYNPLANFKKPKKDNEIIPPPTIPEIKRIINHSPPHLIRALKLSYYTGIRPGAVELFSRQWIHVDFHDKSIFVVSARKGGPSHRHIPLIKEFIQTLKKWKKEDALEYGDDEVDNINIIHYYGKPVKSVKKAFITAKQNAGFTRRLRLYDFRHCFASQLLKKGADLKSTQEMLGHSRVSTTTDIYQHTDTEMHRNAIEKIQSIENE